MRLWSIVLVIMGTEREPFPSHTPSVSLSPRGCVSVLGRPQQSMAGQGLNGRHLFLTALEAGKAKNKLLIQGPVRAHILTCRLLCAHMAFSLSVLADRVQSLHLPPLRRHYSVRVSPSGPNLNQYRHTGGKG